MQYTDKQIAKLLAGIYDGTVTELELPKDLYFAIANYLKQGLYKGFGATIETVFEGDKELLAALRENVYMFSAAKTYQEVKEISSLLVDAEGNIRTEREFNKVGRETFDLWNDTYGTTERNTAILQGQNSVKWAEIERNKELFPSVEYSTIGDACDICGPLNGTVYNVDDPVLDDIAPENHFNCKCILIQREEETAIGANKDVTDGVLENMDDVFKNNAGKSGMVFNEHHPYFTEADKDLGKNNFGLPIPETDEE